jgi:hypothetical protein
MDEAQQYCTCEPCIRGRMREAPHLGRNRQVKYVADVIHADVCGPFYIMDHNKERYWITIVCGHKRFSGTTAIADRAGAWTLIRNFVQYLEGYEPQRMKCRLIHMDGAQEFHRKGFIDLASEREQHGKGQQSSNINPTG